LSGITVAEADTAIPEAAPTSAMPSPDQLLQDLRGQLWPELEQKLAALIAPLEQQLQQQQNSQADSGADALTEVSQKLSDNVQQQFAELKQGFESKASDLLSTTAEQAVAIAVSQLSLDDKLNALLNSEGKNWLQQQETSLKSSIEQELKPAMAASLGPELEASVSQQVLVQLNEQLQRQQQEMMTQQQAALASVKGQLAMQRNLTLGAGLVAIAALVLALI
jgi:DNA polymerase III alpha subunit (gram-positive type)